MYGCMSITIQKISKSHWYFYYFARFLKHNSKRKLSFSSWSSESFKQLVKRTRRVLVNHLAVVIFCYFTIFFIWFNEVGFIPVIDILTTDRLKQTLINVTTKITILFIRRGIPSNYHAAVEVIFGLETGKTNTKLCWRFPDHVGEGSCFFIWFWLNPVVIANGLVPATQSHIQSMKVKQEIIVSK